VSSTEPEHPNRSFESDGLTLAYGDAGAGPPLVLIHGWGAAGSEWQEFGWVSLLAHRHRLLMPDVRGHGRSDKPHEPEAYRMDALARDVAGLLESASTPKAVLFGYSMGGAIALWTAALWPDRVERLVVGAPSGADPEDAAALGRALRGTGPLAERAGSYRDYALRAPGNDLSALAACLETGLPAPACGDLARYHGPALLAAGERDRRYAATQRLASCLLEARFLSIPGADHMGAFGDHGFKRAVIDFLDDVL
jgi:pimeloyl-ACP methyl ester carboxylesterase